MLLIIFAYDSIIYRFLTTAGSLSWETVRNALKTNTG
jgi:hypothetical protein